MACPISSCRRLLGAFLLLSLSSSVLAAPTFERIMILMLENTDYQEAIQQPFISQLAAKGALLTNYHGVGFPSQANYIALVAGSTLGVMSNRNVELNQSHLGDLLDAAGRSWRVYAGGYPGDCFLKKRQGKYVRKHVPFLSFKNVAWEFSRCQSHVVPASQFKLDLQQNTLPDLILYIPNQKNNGHDTDIAHADRWLKRKMASWLKNKEFIDGLLLVITFDEGHRTKKKGNDVLTLLYGNGVVEGSHSGERYDHYSLLRTIEDVWHLGSLNRADSKANPITGIWR